MPRISNIYSIIWLKSNPFAFAQANWYPQGRLRWNYNVSSVQIAAHWLRLNFSNDTSFVNDAKRCCYLREEFW